MTMTESGVTVTLTFDSETGRPIVEIETDGRWDSVPHDRPRLLVILDGQDIHEPEDNTDRRWSFQR
jgi:hypothetical protein